MYSGISGVQQNLISRTCAKVLEVSRPLQFELKYTKAAIAGTEKDI
jgi:hypothetical protein